MADYPYLLALALIEEEGKRAMPLGGKTLKENGLKEIEVIANISTRLIANKASIKTRSNLMNEIIDSFKNAGN